MYLSNKIVSLEKARISTYNLNIENSKAINYIISFTN